MTEIELIVVIDGPDSATEAALSSIADDRMTTICLSSSVGGSGARNVGIRKSRGEFIALLDDDDDDFLPEPETFRRDALKVAPNDRCPCGSGKKYKRCCGA